MLDESGNYQLNWV